MKTLMLVFAALIAVTSHSATFQERQAAFNRLKDQRVYQLVQRSASTRNRRFISLLGAFGAKHGGIAGGVNCTTWGVRSLQYSRQGGTVGTQVLRGAGFVLNLQYMNSDLNVSAYNQDTGSRIPVPTPPQISNCEFNLRNNTTCATQLVDAHRPDNEVGDYLYVTCISPSLKETSVKLGPLFE